MQPPGSRALSLHFPFNSRGLVLNQGNHQVSVGSGLGSESQPGGEEVRLSEQWPSLLDLSPECPLGAHFSPAPRPPAQLRSWATRCGATCPDSAVEPPPPPARAPEPGHLRARGPCSRSALQRWRSSQPCATASQPGFDTPRGEERGRLAAPGAPRPQAAPRPPSRANDPATGTYRVRLRRQRVSPGVHGASGPARPVAAPHSTAQKMDAGGWALPARPAPGAGHWMRPVREEVGPTLCPAGRCSRGLATPRTWPGEGSGGTRGSPATAPRGSRPNQMDSGLRLHLLRGKHNLEPAEGQPG